MARLTATTIEHLARLNSQCFGEDDEFSSAERIGQHIKSGGKCFVSRCDGQIVAYNLLINGGPFYQGLRVGVHRNYRRRGLGLGLVRRSIAYARRQGKSYRTYVLSSNPSSLNVHFRAGMVYCRPEESQAVGNPRLWLIARRQ